MTKVLDVFNFIDSFAPFDTAMEFDNVGILVGSPNADIKKCLITLDVTKNVIDEAKSLNINLIISHHPVIFNPIKTLGINSIPYILAKNDISVICAHTNLDMASLGVNTCLAEAISLQNLYALSYYESKRGNLPIGLVGELNRYYTCCEFAKSVKDNLKCNGVRYTNVSKKIKKVAVCSGSGGNLIQSAIEQNVDAFVTGEIKHHEILLAVQNEICLVDAGHFKTEDIVIRPLVKKLSEKFKDVEFVKSTVFTDSIKYLA